MITNLKIVLFGFYIPAYAATFFQLLLAQGLIDEVELTTLEMVLWSSVISLIGGISAAYRTSININDLLRSGMNTAVMGACLALVATFWTLERPALAWLTIGLSGLLSLGGLATVDWVSRQIKKRIEQKGSQVLDE